MDHADKIHDIPVTLLFDAKDFRYILIGQLTSMPNVR